MFMAARRRSLAVMAPPYLPSASRRDGPPRAPDPARSVAVAVLFVAATLGVLWAVSNPTAAVLLIGLAGGVLVGARGLRRRLRDRRRAGSTRRLCAPRVGVCLEL